MTTMQPTPTTYAELESRFGFHPADTPERVTKHEAVRSSALHLADLLNELMPPSREASLALTAVQEAAMWANAAIAIHSPHAGEVPK